MEYSNRTSERCKRNFFRQRTLTFVQSMPDNSSGWWLQFTTQCSLAVAEMSGELYFYHPNRQGSVHRFSHTDAFAAVPGGKRMIWHARLTLIPFLYLTKKTFPFGHVCDSFDDVFIREFKPCCYFCIFWKNVYNPLSYLFWCFWVFFAFNFLKKFVGHFLLSFFFTIESNCSKSRLSSRLFR